MAIASVVLPPLGELALLAVVASVAPWLRDHGWLGLGLYVAFSTPLVGIGLMPSHAQSLLAGWAFGFWNGWIAALLVKVLAAWLTFIAVRRASGDRVEKLMDEKPKWKAVHDALVGCGFARSLFIVTLLRILPNIPFAASNVVMASTRVGVVPYLLGTVLGMMPRTALTVSIGTGIRDLTSAQPSHPIRTTVSIAGTVVAAVVIALIDRSALKRAIHEA